ncbi:uncharacterized protein LOC141994112 [Natator depressus]|uniref:uncharacterized protein LOC141994112 n=1 Tax=Natator depressus TaxID=27790 RepID=UPI003EBEFB17
MRSDRPLEVSHNACSSHSGHHFELYRLAVSDHQTCPLNSPGILKIPFLFAQQGMECSQCIFPGDHASRRQAVPSMEQWWGAGPRQCGEEAVQSQLHSSHRNCSTFGKISRDMMERGHDWDALQCRVKVKELQNAYRKARKANCYSGAAPATCRFYKELDAIVGGDPTSTPRTTMDTSELSSTSQEEEEESGSEGAEEEDDTPASPDASSQELSSGQEEGSQSQWPVLGEDKHQRTCLMQP